MTQQETARTPHQGRAPRQGGRRRHNVSWRTTTEFRVPARCRWLSWSMPQHQGSHHHAVRRLRLPRRNHRSRRLEHTVRRRPVDPGHRPDVQLAGQPVRLGAWPPGRRRRLRMAVRPAVRTGASGRTPPSSLGIPAGYELEFQLSHAEPAPTGACFSPTTSGLRPLRAAPADAFATQLLHDLQENGVQVGQFHAEYGPAQVELSIAAADPLIAADQQLLARQTIHAAAQAHGLRAAAPLVTSEGVGNGWHLHTSVSRRGQSARVATVPTRLTSDGAAYVAGLLRDLPAIVAVTAPSVPSLTRLRPGYFAGAMAFGAEPRSCLRLVPATDFLGPPTPTSN